MPSFAEARTLAFRHISFAPSTVCGLVVSKVVLATAAETTGTARKVLWTPSPEAVEATEMRRFQREVGVEGGYDELWRWSVDNSDEVNGSNLR